jgi:hypothetical protein
VKKKNLHWVMDSKHPYKDITALMRLMVLSSEKGLFGEWQLEYLFGPNAHHPKKMEPLDVYTNYTLVKFHTRISGRTVIGTGLNATDIESFNDALTAGTDEDKAERTLEIKYVTADTRDTKKPF